MALCNLEASDVKYIASKYIASAKCFNFLISSSVKFIIFYFLSLISTVFPPIRAKSTRHCPALRISVSLAKLRMLVRSSMVRYTYTLLLS